MVDSTFGLLAAIGMAVGAPLIYADQAHSMAKVRDSTGFSKDVCAVVLLSNIARLVWWFHERYELVLVVQSCLMVVAQIALLSLVLRFHPGSYASSAYTSSYQDYLRSDPGPARPGRPNGEAARPRPEINVEPPTPEQQHANLPPPATASSSNTNEYSNPGFRSLFGGGSSSSSGGGYAPIVGDFRFPTMPLLDAPEGYAASQDEHDGEEDTDPVSLPTRLARQGKHSFGRFARRLKPLLGVRNDGSLRADGSSSGRPFGFWTWTSLESYIVFLVCYTLFLLALQITIGRVSSMYNALLGLYALGLESTLPLPQLIANQKRRSLAGFRLSVLAGWSLGDLFKVVYFLFLKPGSPFQFLAGALFSLSVDIGIVAQAKMFAEKTAEDEEELRVASEGRRMEEAERQRRAGGDGPGRDQQQQRPASAARSGSSSNGPRAKSAPSSASASQDPWLQEHADLDEDAVLFDSSHGLPDNQQGRQGPKGSQHFTIEADDD